jgi:hypothetical protein
VFFDSFWDQIFGTIIHILKIFEQTALIVVHAIVFVKLAERLISIALDCSGQRGFHKIFIHWHSNAALVRFPGVVIIGAAPFIGTVENFVVKATTICANNAANFGVRNTIKAMAMIAHVVSSKNYLLGNTERLGFWVGVFIKGLQ